MLFFGITMISAATLGWLSWQLVRQDRALATQRAQEQRESAVDIAVAALQKDLSKQEDAIAAIASAGDNLAIEAEAHARMRARCPRTQSSLFSTPTTSRPIRQIVFLITRL